MSDHGLTKDNLLRAFPLALRADESVAALADATADALTRLPSALDVLRIYARIAELPETLLDILAYDFKVDWWNPDYSLDEKRRTLQSSWMVHKRLGTQWAVRTALDAIYPGSTVEPWYAYGGDPYYFRLLINANARIATLEEQARTLQLVRFYQSLRDRLDGILYTLTAKEPAVIRLGGTFSTDVRFPIPEAADILTPKAPAVVRLGGAVSSAVRLPVPEAADILTSKAPTIVHLGGAVSSTVHLPIPETADTLTTKAPAAVRMGGAVGAVVDLPVPEDTSIPIRASPIHFGGCIGAVVIRFPIPEQKEA